MEEKEIINPKEACYREIEEETGLNTEILEKGNFGIYKPQLYRNTERWLDRTYSILYN